MKTFAAIALSASIALPATSAFAESYKVRAGDTLWGISNTYKVSVADLQKENRISGSLIYVGQTLKIPGQAQKVLEKQKVATDGKDNLNVRSGPATSYKVIGKLAHGKVVEVYEYKGNWAVISFDGKKAYAHRDYLVNVNEKPKGENKPKENTTATKYTVKHGDYLYKIGQMYKVPYQKIIEWNKLKSNVLYTGQVLIVSEPKKEPPAKEEKEKAPVTTTYVVKKGDYLQKIANQFGVTVKNLKAWNGLSSDLIFPNQKLIVSKDAVKPSYFILPAQGTFTSGYGKRNHPISGVYGSHFGLDIAKSGTVPVYAAADGKVTQSYVSASYGEVIFIEHLLGGNVYETVYAHMKKNSRVLKVGDTVKQGDRIGYMGATGDASGQHLHFEIHEGKWNMEKSNSVDPLLYF